MKIQIEKNNIFGVLLLVDTCIQLGSILFNAITPTDNINYFLFINNYVIGGLIIASLIVKGASKHFLAISFFGCYMLFLMGQKPFQEYYDVFLTFSRVKLDTKQYLLFSSILFIGLIITYYAYTHFYQTGATPYRVEFDNENSNEQYQKIKPILTVLLCLTLPCAFYMQAKIVLVRGGMAYTAGYLVNVDVPGIIKAGYYIYSTVVLLYLALKPTKGQLYFILGSFILIEGGLQLFQGRRALFASTMLFCTWYLFKYYNVQHIKTKYLIRVGSIIVAMVVLFYVVEQSRSSSSTKLSLNLIRRFLISTGGSDSVLANTIYRADDFPASGIAYLLDPLINNPIGNLLLGKGSSAQGMVYLQQHNSFSHWISYMTESSLYLSGHGMGSCYLAEVYLAFGIVGVLFISVLIGWVIEKLNRMSFNSNFFRSALIFFIVRNLFTLPRAGLLSWMSNLVYLFFTIAIVYPFYSRDLTIRVCRSKVRQ